MREYLLWYHRFNKGADNYENLLCYELIPRYSGIRGASCVSLFVSSTRRDQIKSSLFVREAWSPLSISSMRLK